MHKDIVSSVPLSFLLQEKQIYLPKKRRNVPFPQFYKVCNHIHNGAGNAAAEFLADWQSPVGAVQSVLPQSSVLQRFLGYSRRRKKSQKLDMLPDILKEHAKTSA